MNTILVTLPVNGTQKAVLENAGENCRFLYETDSSKTEELIPEADIIIGNVPAGDIHAVEGDLPAGWVVKTDYAAPDRCFAGTAFAHQAVGFPGIDVKGNAVHSLDGIAAGNGEMLLQVFHPQ